MSKNLSLTISCSFLFILLNRKIIQCKTNTIVDSCTLENCHIIQERLTVIEIGLKNVVDRVANLEQRLSSTENESANGTESSEEKLSYSLAHCLNSNSDRVLNCKDIMNKGITISGVYGIFIEKLEQCIEVFCDMDTSGGGWTLIQHHYDGTVNFNRSWEDYKNGFGNISDEHWLGNKYIHALTYTKDSELRFDLVSYDTPPQNGYAVYQHFKVGDEVSNFVVSFGGYSGNVGDSFSYHNHCQFSTFDRDNDRYSGTCTDDFFTYGGFWYSSCAFVGINNFDWNNDGSEPVDNDIFWFKWKRLTSLRSVAMKIRPID